MSTLKREDFSITITFTDGSNMVVNQHEWEEVLGDVMEGRPNKIYERLRDERDRGNTDVYGYIHLLDAYDPKTIKEIWENNKV
ncbi:MAG TPA: hypothetical protein VN456_06590 [Desulfosporosinus sp.]|nr:hypothetical protein [Desulfosporosinus sp.]